MRIVSLVAVCLTAFVCAGALALSVQPGEVNRYVLPLMLVGAVPLASLCAGGIALGIVVWQCGGWGGLNVDARRMRALAAAGLGCGALLIGTYGLLRLYVPRRIAFAAYRADFDELAEAQREGTPAVGGSIGPWRVEAIASDPRGGLYVRVNETDTGFFGAVRTSWGFAQRPNPYGAPFGREDYRTHALSGEWTWFRATDTSSSY